MTVTNTTPQDWTQVEIWVNRQYRLTVPSIPAGQRFQAPLSIFIEAYGHRFDFARQQINERLGARILSIVDCYDALTSDRPYRRALSHGCAMTMIQERRGTMYDPEIVSAFLRIVERMHPFGREMARAV